MLCGQISQLSFLPVTLYLIWQIYLQESAQFGVFALLELASSLSAFSLQHGTMIEQKSASIGS
jgi:hypothetical protein